MNSIAIYLTDEQKLNIAIDFLQDELEAVNNLGVSNDEEKQFFDALTCIINFYPEAKDR